MAKYIIDQTHSDISFKVKYMMISSVEGCFNNYEASLISSKEDLSDAAFECEIDVSSLYTGNVDRDTHLISSEFLSSESFPAMIFKSTNTKIVDGEYIVDGLLQIKEHSRPVTLRGKYLGVTVDSCGQEKYCFELKGSIKRFSWFLDFVITSSKTVLVDNNIELNLDLQFLKAED